MSTVEPPGARPRVVVVGAGLIGRRHLELVAGSGRCDLVAVVDPAPAAREVAERYRAAYHRDLGEMLDQHAGADLGVVVATPNSDHVTTALRCLERGAAVLVEKPVADDLAGARRLVQACAGTDARVLVGHHRRHSPLLATAREVIGSGTLGAVVAVQGSATYYKPDDYFDAAPWRRRPGGGPILINLVHEVDDLRMLCGDVASVQAVASSAARGFEVEDTVAVTLRFTSGALGSFLLSDAAASARSWELTSGEDPAYPTHPGESCYEVAGTRGSLSVPTMTLRSYDGPASWWEPLRTRVLDVARTDPLAAQLDHFVDVVTGRAAPAVTPLDATRTLATTLAVGQAARTGASVAPGELLAAAGGRPGG